ncbi:protein APEM9 isoform X2 [Punica granatum]|uniref:Uncharacterized protein n=2 Tax=Punica granatum TaxID=22663 RepID=A0A218XNT3_PUNGR|nr:protein APEM9 isoform X2 [Punica granatum]OWM86895.1 hypothetical protein CDL15_Pgr015931 [Punica granatum]PKI37582.1 hypothetical protein CRG98_042006 [Punica granatum]
MALEVGTTETTQPQKEEAKIDSSSASEMVEITPIEAEASIWEDIERCESYLVCSMYEDAASSASSVLKRLRRRSSDGGADGEFHEMVVSAGMVLVQSLKELGRTSDILNQLRTLFGCVAAMPVEVFLTGVCFQISEGSTGVGEILEEFLGNWNYVDAGYYTPVDKEENSNCKHFVLTLDKYLEVAEIYVLTVLGRILNDGDLATSWVEKAALPEEKRQELLRKLHSLYSVKATNSELSSSENMLDENEALLKEEILPKGFLNSIDARSIPIGESDKKKAILKLYGKTETGFWWFRTIGLKIGNTRMVISNGKILLGCLILLACFVLRRKGANLKRFIKKQAVSIKNALLDFWKLAFSYQVNPLAAVQPLAAPGAAIPAGR